MGTIRILWVKKRYKIGQVDNGAEVGEVGEGGEKKVKNSVLLATNKQNP